MKKDASLTSINSTNPINPKTPETIRTQILDLVRQYHQAKFADKSFDPGKDLVHYAGINKSFFIGVYPGIDDKRLNHIKALYDRFMAGERVS